MRNLAPGVRQWLGHELCAAGHTKEMAHHSDIASVPSHTEPEGPVWARWVYLGLTVLAGAQLLAAALEEGGGEPAVVSGLVGVIAFPALAATAFLRARGRGCSCSGKQQARPKPTRSGS